MKTKLQLALLVMLMSFCQLYAQNFNIEYKKFDSLSNISKLVHQVAIAPKWTDSVSFTYEIREEGALKNYSVNILKRSKVLIDKELMSAKSDSTFLKRDHPKVIVSPDGKWEAYVTDFNIWLRATGDKNESDLTSKKEIQLSFDGTENLFYSQINWSPDSKKIAAIQTLEAKRHRIPLLESAPTDQKQPKLQWRDYYKPGDVIPVNRPTLFNIEQKTKIEIDTKEFANPYQLFFRKWSNDSGWFSFDFNQRGHQTYQIVNVDAQNGSVSIVVNEHFNTFVHYGRNFIYYTEDTKNIIWSSERDGWRHLYQIDAVSGTIKRALTKGKWVVREVVKVNEKDDYIIFSANGKNKGEDPYNLHYYRMNMDGSRLTELTPENANHKATFSPDNKYFIDVYSRPDLEPISVVRSAEDGSVLMELGRADISELLTFGWCRPEVFSARGRDGVTDIWGTIYRPSTFDPSQKYPVVEYIYAGPHDAHVTKDFAAYMRFSKLMEMGFIVVTIDGMGTANRSKTFHDVCWRDLKDAGFPDRILWIKTVSAKYPSVDVNRGVGIYGYSAGGQNAMSALLFQGDFYKTAVSLCGCHDNRMDKIWWNEQWMGYPIGPWYSASSNVDNAHLLDGDLLLINGELDDNVDPASTLQVVDALVKAGKDFEQLYLPGHGHSLGSDYITKRVFEFFWRKMQINHNGSVK
ncbi:MAG: DPP IV N-terminal domain-containing protein [Salinivirgaceae bacterium]|nr:DPP IV N-terminal domain-containing protein [Salinivirgaceae bacterium]MDY0281042.1 DPP IV N-terminal domain-containing protein [Salinivirgaceae bacterium]